MNSREGKQRGRPINPKIILASKNENQSNELTARLETLQAREEKALSDSDEYA